MEKIRQMTSMEYDDEDSMDAAQPIPMPSKPAFPYGLRITLSEKELKKLNIDHQEAEVGGIFHGHFMARVTSVSEDKRENGEVCCRIEAQIEDLAIESEDAENEADEAAEDEAPGKRKRAPIYG